MNFPCKCGIPFDTLPFEFHPKQGSHHRIVWRRLRGDNNNTTECVELSGQASQMTEAHLLPGDWDMYDASSGITFRIHIRKPIFKLCTSYQPDNLKYLEQCYEEINK